MGVVFLLVCQEYQDQHHSEDEDGSDLYEKISITDQQIATDWRRGEQPAALGKNRAWLPF